MIETVSYILGRQGYRPEINVIPQSEYERLGVRCSIL